MKMATVKNEKDIRLDGIKAEIVKRDNTTIRVILRDTLGNVLEVGKGEYSDLQVMVPAPPEKKKAFKVTGSIAGIPIDENFDGKYEADQRKEKLELLSAEDLLVKEVEVEVA